MNRNKSIRGATASILVGGRAGWILLLILALLVVPQARPSLAAGGAYTIKWYAADPAVNSAPYLPTYAKVTPGMMACPTPSGGTGQAADPLTNAVAYGPTSATLDALTAMQPEDMALGQIVPFEVVITVSGSTAPENGTIQFKGGWNTHTQSGDPFGYDKNVPTNGVYCAFVDTADPGANDPGTDAKVDSYSGTVVNPGTTTEEIQGTFTVSGLDNGDRIIVEIWVVLQSTTTSTDNSNVASRLISAQTVYTTPETINAGNQSVGLLQVQDFYDVEADISVTKSDSPDPVSHGAQVTYEIVVINNSTDTVANGITVTDKLDAATFFDPASDASCSDSGGTVTCNGFFLAPGTSRTIYVIANVLNTAPTDGTTKTGECTWGSTGGATNVDLCNEVSVSAITSDPDTSNNTDTEPTDVEPTTAVTLNSFDATASDGVVVVEWQTASEIDNLGFNLYRADAESSVRARLNETLIPSLVAAGSPVGALYKYVDDSVQLGVEYSYWLEQVDTAGSSMMHGPVSAGILTFAIDPGLWLLPTDHFEIGE